MNSSKIERISGTAMPLRGNDIDTDRIVPARYLRCVTFEGLGQHAFEDDKGQDQNHPFNQKKFAGASILIVGKNFGCGSSREHAPQALNKWGIKGIIGQSFAEIFFANCQALGIPCFTISEDECEALFRYVEDDPSLVVTMDIKLARIQYADDSIVAGIPAGAQRSLVEGTWNATSVLLQAADKVDKLAGSLPYINNFST